MLDERYLKLQKEIKVKFENTAFLDLAFVHKSYLNEHRNLKSEHNERLEFLGDAVLELVVTEFLFNKFPDQEEGVMTNWRAALVNGKHLAEVAVELDLGLYLYLSRGEERSGGRKKNYILANTVEALIGAIYLDKGYKKALAFIDKFILCRLENILEQGAHIDAKSRLQETSQDKNNITPLYKKISESGPDHKKEFVMGVFLGDEQVAIGKGSSKQLAEQEAAKNALLAKKWL